MGSSDQGTPAFLRLAGHPLRWRLLSELAHSDYRVRELSSLLGEPQNLISYHLRVLRDGDLLAARRSSFDGRDSYYHLNVDRCAEMLGAVGTALHPSLRRSPGPRPSVGDLRRSPRIAVLFVCTGNSARSPIAEALLRHHTRGQVETVGAGSQPRSRIHPNAVRALRDEVGIDISGQPTRHLDTLTARRFDYVISLCDKARETCPDFSGRPRRMHWSISDPATAADSEQASFPAFQHATADMDRRIRHLLPVLAATAERRSLQ